MECNKKEAFNLKELAEEKFQSQDFLGAREFILKAQQLYPKIDENSHFLSVCDVLHCSSKNVFGTDLDWYGILQVEQTADEKLITEQYRKFAFRLHPDKNQFSGAEAAFKLIGQAYTVLLDKEKRGIYDTKREHQTPQQQASKNVGVASLLAIQNNFPNKADQHGRASNTPPQGTTPQPQPANDKATFWTRCLHCSVCYKYYRDVIGQALRCQNCKKSFDANDMDSSTNVQPEAKKSNSTFDAGQKSEAVKSQKVPSKPSKVDRQGDEGSKPRITNGQSTKKPAESSESFEYDISSDSEDVEIQAAADPRRSQHLDSDGECRTRRLNQNKRLISYEQVGAPSKKAKGSATEEKVDAENASGSAHEGVESPESPPPSPEFLDWSDSEWSMDDSEEPSPEIFHYPDPEFYDFDESRKKENFNVGQVWALYDELDAMPRVYAKIKSFSKSRPDMNITWLEADPDDDIGKKWVHVKLPFSCGKFKMGISKEVGINSFSHLVSESNFVSIGGKSYMIYPRVGETWAIFKNWDANWCSSKTNFEYDFVEVISSNSMGIMVVLLEKVLGHRTVFIRKTVNHFEIRASEMLRFSHMVPSHRIEGKENVPMGSFELDPASAMSIDDLSNLGRKDAA